MLFLPLLIVVPLRWLNGKASISGAEGRGFDHRPSQTKDFRNDSVMGALLGDQGGRISITTDCLVSG